MNTTGDALQTVKATLCSLGLADQAFLLNVNYISVLELPISPGQAQITEVQKFCPLI